MAQAPGTCGATGRASKQAGMSEPTELLAVITGASRGIGAGIAAAAEADGATVAAANRSGGSRGHDLTIDLSDPAAWAAFARWYDDLVDELRPRRIMAFHNAATIEPIGFAGEVDPDAYRANVLLNSAAPQVLGGSVLQTAQRAEIPTVLVQLSSGAGKTPFTGWSSYCASKAAVDMWVRTVGLETTERGDLTRVLSIAPGVVATDMQANIRNSESDAFPAVDNFRTMHETGALADPAEVGARLWHYASAGDWPSGTVADIREL